MPGTPACPEKVRTFCLHVIHFDVCEFFPLCFCLLTSWLACDVRCCIGTSPITPRRSSVRQGSASKVCALVMHPQLCEEGDTAGSPGCSSSICFFNNSAAGCISLSSASPGGPDQEGEGSSLRRWEAGLDRPGRKAADILHPSVFPPSIPSSKPSPSLPPLPPVLPPVHPGKIGLH